MYIYHQYWIALINAFLLLAILLIKVPKKEWRWANHEKKEKEEQKEGTKRSTHFDLTLSDQEQKKLRAFVRLLDCKRYKRMLPDWINQKIYYLLEKETSDPD